MRDGQRRSQPELYRKLCSVVGSLNTVKLEVSLWNIGLAHIVFISKVLALTSSILGGYIMIYDIKESNYWWSLLALLFLLLGLSAYIGMYNYAFQIPQSIQRLKDEVLTQSQALTSPDQRRELRMRLAGIPKIGIRSSGFQYIERASTLIYIDYVATQIVNLLLAF